MSGATVRDDPWRRVPWLLPTAALLALISLMSFLKLLAGPPLTLAQAPPIEVDVVELAPSPPATRAPPALAPPPMETPPLAETPPPPPFVQSLPLPPPEVKPSPPPPPRPPSRTRPQRAPPTPATPPSPAVAAPPSPAPAPPVENAPPSGGTAGARALYQPLPEIPDELRRRAIDLVAVARFRVAANGAAEVELIQPTPDATLNRALLEALKKWRFFPALEAGQPVASSMEIRIPISVR
jgi:protein TonB